MAKKKDLRDITVVEVIKPSDEDLILGAEEEVKEVKVIDYASLDKRYKVKNLIKNRVYEVHGRVIDVILGNNEKAKKMLKEGAKKVELTERKEKQLITTHIIEVIK